MISYRALTAAVAVALTSGSLAVNAAPTFNIPAGPFELKFTNFELFTQPLPAAGCSNRDADATNDCTSDGTPGGTPITNNGVLRVTSITDSFANQVWSDGTAGAELTGVFYDIVIDEVTLSGGDITVLSTGGTLDVYINPFGSLAAAGGFGQGTGGYLVPFTDYNGISNVGAGGLFLTADWVPGVIPGDLATTVEGDFDALAPATGEAAGYLAVRPNVGLYGNKFDSNTLLGGAADLFSQNDFCTLGLPNCGTPVGNWPLRSNDPVRGTALPEPSTVALLGLGVLGIGFSARRRRAA